MTIKRMPTFVFDTQSIQLLATATHCQIAKSAMQCCRNLLFGIFLIVVAAVATAFPTRVEQKGLSGVEQHFK